MHSPSLRKLEVTRCETTPDSLMALLNGICHSRSLHTFTFENGDARALVDISSFAFFLRDIRSISTLHLSLGCIDEVVGYNEFWKAMAKNQTILTLWFAIDLTSDSSPFSDTPVIQALESNKIMKTISIYTNSEIKPSEETYAKLKRAKYDSLTLSFGFGQDQIFEYSAPETLNSHMILEAYRLVKFGRHLSGCRSSQDGFRLPLEILIRIFTRGMITEQDWIPEQLDAILRCLLKRSTYGLISDPDLAFNESSLFVVCNRALSNLAKE